LQAIVQTVARADRAARQQLLQRFDAAHEFARRMEREVAGRVCLRVCLSYCVV
jgi:hypothetical protein